VSDREILISQLRAKCTQEQWSCFLEFPLLDGTDYSSHKRLCQIVILSKVSLVLNVLRNMNMELFLFSVALGDGLFGAQTAVSDFERYWV